MKDETGIKDRSKKSEIFSQKFRSSNLIDINTLDGFIWCNYFLYESH